MSLVAVYTATEVCESGANEMFYAKLDSVLNQCPRRDTLIVLVTSMLPLALKKLTMSYVLVSEALVSGTPTTLSF